MTILVTLILIPKINSTTENNHKNPMMMMMMFTYTRYKRGC
jgi:hypothetical protein